MEKHFIRIIRQWFWLMVLTTLIASGASLAFARNRPATYEAKARLIVGPGIDSVNPDLNALKAGGLLMQTYAELPTTGPFITSIISELKLGITPGKLGKMIQIKTNQETQILTITVQDQNPDQAIAITNAIANHLVRMSPSVSGNSVGLLRDEIQAQVDKLNGLIAASQAKLTELEGQLKNTSDLARQRLIMDQISQERANISDAVQAILQINDTLQKPLINQVKILEVATGAQKMGPQAETIVLIAAVAGLLMGLVIVLVVEYFDDSIKTPDDLLEISGLPLLGIIDRDSGLRKRAQESLVTLAEPFSRGAEDYRMIAMRLASQQGSQAGRNDHRTTMDRSNPDSSPSPRATGERKKFSILMGSLEDEDHSGRIAANLGVVLAQMGNRVILVDSNAWSPSVNNLFDISNQPNPANGSISSSKPSKLRPVENIPGLSLLSGEPDPASHIDPLSDNRMTELMQELENRADIVILVSPPLSSFADGYFLARHVDGLILVGMLGHTARKAALEIVQNLKLLNIPVIGAILDKNPSTRARKASPNKAAPGLKAQLTGQTQAAAPTRGLFETIRGRFTWPKLHPFPWFTRTRVERDLVNQNEPSSDVQ